MIHRRKSVGSASIAEQDAEAEFGNAQEQGEVHRNMRERVVVRSAVRRKEHNASSSQDFNPSELRQETGAPPKDEGDAGDTKPRLSINDLTRMGMHGLRELATQYGIPPDDLAPLKKQELIFAILKAHTEHGGIIFASGA